MLANGISDNASRIFATADSDARGGHVCVSRQPKLGTFF